MLRKWIRLLIGVAAIAAFVTALHQLTAQLGGSTGEMIVANQEQNREVYAYVYSEVGDLREFLDDEHGRYGRQALVKALSKGE